MEDGKKEAEANAEEPYQLPGTDDEAEEGEKKEPEEQTTPAQTTGDKQANTGAGNTTDDYSPVEGGTEGSPDPAVRKSAENAATKFDQEKDADKEKTDSKDEEHISDSDNEGSQEAKRDDEPANDEEEEDKNQEEIDELEAKLADLQGELILSDEQFE